VEVTLSRWRAFGALTVLVLAGRLSYLFIGYAADPTRSTRPQVETSTLLFVLAGLGLRAATASQVSPERTTQIPLRLVLLPIMCATALALYWPAVHIGYLSDDFILEQQAASWQFGSVAPQLFRPVPLAVWSLLLHAGGGAVSLHLFNILLHGANAFLTACVVRAWTPGRWWPTLAGLLVLTSPLAPEAVAWGAGVFDVMSTTFVLLAVLIARRYEIQPSLGNRLLLWSLCAGALLSKETAAITPILIALDGWMRGSITKRLMNDLIFIGVAVVFFGAARLYSNPWPMTPPVSKYRLQRVLFDSFGTMANPWHLDLFPSPLAISLFSGLSALSLLTTFFLIAGSARRTKTIIAAGLWILASLIPVVPLFYVSAALEGSRYLYLGMVGWAAGLLIAASDVGDARPRFRTVTVPIVILTIALAAFGARRHLRPWVEASTVRDLVLTAASRNQQMHACEVLSVGGLPQTVRGGYVFSNGAREAFAEVGLNAYVRDGTGPCAFTWNSSTSGFEPAAARIQGR